MKQLLISLALILIIQFSYSQTPFADTAQLNQYLRDTLRDRRPDKVTAAQIQKAFLGVTAFLSSGAQSMDTLTRSEAQDLMDDGQLVPGKLYYITGVDNSLYGGTNIILKAASNNVFSADGVGFFCNPIYTDDPGYGIWQGRITEMVLLDYSGEFEFDETVETSTGAVGNWLSPDFIITSDEETPWTTGVFEITGEETESTAQIQITTIPSYTLGQTVIWGGRVWTNKTGARGYADGDFELNSEDWELVPYSNTTAYRLVADAIKYDCEHNMIVGRREEAGDNEVSCTWDWAENFDRGNPVKGFQWGNGFNVYRSKGVGMQRIHNGYNGNINFRGMLQTDIAINNFSYQVDVYFDENSYQRYFTLTDNSRQYDLLFFGSNQEHIRFENFSNQNDGVLFNTIQNGIYFVDGSQRKINFSSNYQGNIHFFYYNWSRDFVPVSGSETNIFRFRETDLNTVGKNQAIAIALPYAISTAYQSTDEVVVEQLSFPLDEDQSFTFEYDLLVDADVSCQMNYLIHIPENPFSFHATFTLIDQTDNTVQSVRAGEGDTVTLNMNHVGPYHLKITGSLLYAHEGAFSLGMWPTSAPYSTATNIEKGSFVRFTRLDFNYTSD